MCKINSEYILLEHLSLFEKTILFSVFTILKHLKDIQKTETA